MVKKTVKQEVENARKVLNELSPEARLEMAEFMDFDSCDGMFSSDIWNAIEVHDNRFDPCKPERERTLELGLSLKRINVKTFPDKDDPDVTDYEIMPDKQKVSNSIPLMPDKKEVKDAD